ncbi:MAG: hypothetical protein AAF490_32960, partial [Chloroflexota bacterium]
MHCTQIPRTVEPIHRQTGVSLASFYTPRTNLLIAIAPTNIMLNIQRHHIIITILTLLLAGSLWLSWIIFQQAETFYIHLNATRLSPLGLHAFANEEILSDDKITITMFGDSRAAQWPTEDNDQFSFVNRGIGAQTSVQVAQRYDAHVAPIQTNILLLQVGINDLKTIGLFPDDEAIIVANVQKSIDQIVTQAEEDDAIVILTTIFPTGEVPLQRRPFWSSQI